MSEPKKLVILGIGGNSIDIVDIVHDINAASSQLLYEIVGFLDDDETTWGTDVQGIEVLGPLSLAGDLDDECFVNGIGSPANFWFRDAITAKTGLPLDRFETLVHPLAGISSTVEIGKGSVVYPSVTIGNNTRLGNHVLVRANSAISHDDRIGDYTLIGAGVCVSGGVDIGHSCYLGSNCTLLQDITVGDRCLLGMGGVVLRDVETNSVVVGNPARFLKHTREE